MGFGLNRISPITFDGDIFQTPENRGKKGRVPTSTPRKTSAQPEEEAAQQQQLPANRMYTTNQVPQQIWESGSRSYDADTSARDTQCICNTQGRYIPPQQRHPNDHGPRSGSGNGSGQSSDREAVDDTTICTGIPHQKTNGTDPQSVPSSNSETQAYPNTQQLIGVIGVTQTSTVKSTQRGGMQTTPPNCPGKTTSSGGTQTSPPRPFEYNKCDQGTQGQLNHNQEAKTDTQPQVGKGRGSKGEKGKKRSPEPSDHHLGTSSNTEPRRDFTSRNLGTGRFSIQCSAYSKYNHWSRMCPYDNFCTTCKDHSHVTHMCRAPKDIPVICIYCGNSNHRSRNCPNKPLDNREQSHETPEALRNQQNQQANTEISGNSH